MSLLATISTNRRALLDQKVRNHVVGLEMKDMDIGTVDVPMTRWGIIFQHREINSCFHYIGADFESGIDGIGISDTHTNMSLTAMADKGTQTSFSATDGELAGDSASVTTLFGEGQIYETSAATKANECHANDKDGVIVGWNGPNDPV